MLRCGMIVFWWECIGRAFLERARQFAGTAAAATAGAVASSLESLQSSNSLSRLESTEDGSRLLALQTVLQLALVAGAPFSPCVLPKLYALRPCTYW